MHKTHLALPLPYAPFDHLRQNLEQALQIPLKTRGEAHVTIITPIEFKAIQTHITMQELVAIVQKTEPQRLPLQLLCIGEGTIFQQEQILSTYFAVTEPAALIRMRVAIRQHYLNKGGDKNCFDPEHYYPHVTLGFTERDLHLADGVVKDRSAYLCALQSLAKPR